MQTMRMGTLSSGMRRILAANALGLKQVGGVANGRCGYGTLCGRGMRGGARQSAWVRRSVPISRSSIDAILLQSRGCWRRLGSDPLGVVIELSPPIAAKEAAMEMEVRAWG